MNDHTGQGAAVEPGAGNPPPAPSFTPYSQEQVAAYFGGGLEGELNPQMLAHFTELANENQLHDGAIRSLVDYEKALMNDALQRGDALYEQQQEAWRTELENDSMLHEGEGRDANLAKLAVIVRDYGGELDENGMNEFKDMLNFTGAGNHPAMARFLMRLSAALPGEGKPTSSRTGTGGDVKPLADRFFS